MANVLGLLSEGVPPDPSLLDTLLDKAYEEYGFIKGKRPAPHVQSRSDSILLRHTAPASKLRQRALSRAKHGPTIPVPRLHRHWEKDGTGYLVMDYMEGDMLQRVWRKLSSGMRKLAGFIEDLRRIPQPPPSPVSDLPHQGWVGSHLGNPMADFSMTWMDASFGPVVGKVAEC